MTPTWESRPVVAPVVQVRIAAMQQWLWTESDISRAARKVGASS